MRGDRIVQLEGLESAPRVVERCEEAVCFGRKTKYIYTRHGDDGSFSGILIDGGGILAGSAGHVSSTFIDSHRRRHRLTFTSRLGRDLAALRIGVEVAQRIPHRVAEVTVIGTRSLDPPLVQDRKS